MRSRAALAAALVVASCGAPSTPAPVATPPRPDPAIDAIDAFVATRKIDKREIDWRMDLPVPPDGVAFDPATDYRVAVDTTKGRFVIRLMPEQAPYSVTSFLYLVRLGFYDGLTFHRVIPGFMVQGGCPRGDGTGGPGYEFDGEVDPTNVRFDRPFRVATANAGPGTDGSQFFVTVAPTPHLDGKHSIFGEVVEGQDVVRAIEKCGSESGITSEPLTMTRLSIDARKKK
ncbi:MAG: peptidylprolyl isomerase [Planctomycetes bacterium]|nr:peptidylprolyl isomerase [Planctomycetota bacterium]MBI3847756.1 peptidylprolyl isomerase [Planctomycetota bacterium]